MNIRMLCGGRLRGWLTVKIKQNPRIVCSRWLCSGALFVFLPWMSSLAIAQTCPPLQASGKAEIPAGHAEALVSALHSLQAGDYRRALAIAESILQSLPDSNANTRVTAAAIMAATHAASGNLVAAKPWFDLADSARPTVEPNALARIESILAWVELRAGNTEKAEALLRNALSRNPSLLDARRIQLTLARAPLATEKRVAAARAVLSFKGQDKSTMGLERASALEILAEIIEKEDYQRVRQLIEEERSASTHSSQRSILQYSLALLAFRMGDLKEALLHSAPLEVAWLDQTVTPDPRWMWVRARILETAGEYSQAAQAYDLALAEAARQRQPLDLALMTSGLSFQQRFAPLFESYLGFLLGPHSSLSAEEAKQKAVDVAELSRLADITGLMRDPCLVADARQRSQIMDATTAVLYPVLLSDRTELLLVTRSGIRRFPSNAGKAEVQVRTTRWLAQLQQFATRLYLPTARSLHEVLIAPVLPSLHELGIRHLVIAPDGVLRTIPFAALHDGKRFLIEEFSLSVVPGLNLTQVQPMNRGGIKTLAVGLSESRQGFEALPAVEQELTFVARALQCTPVLNGAFTKQRLRQDLSSSRASVVHVASHAEFSPDPRNTFLLTYDGKLGLEEIRDALLTSARQRAPLDLLVLSACQTAVGDERAALGLAGMALRTGARSAVASLWQVSDDSTNKLVQRFYAGLIAEGRSRGEALRIAQLDVLKSDEFSHPAFWAPFILVGSWM